MKDEAEAVLEAIGLTTSDAVGMMRIRIAREKKLPFEPIIPNAKTVAAIKAARAGNTSKVGGVKGLLADLNADD